MLRKGQRRLSITIDKNLDEIFNKIIKEAQEQNQFFSKSGLAVMLIHYGLEYSKLIHEQLEKSKENKEE